MSGFMWSLFSLDGLEVPKRAWPSMALQKRLPTDGSLLGFMGCRAIHLQNRGLPDIRGKHGEEVPM